MSSGSQLTAQPWGRGLGRGKKGDSNVAVPACTSRRDRSVAQTRNLSGSLGGRGSAQLIHVHTGNFGCLHTVKNSVLSYWVNISKAVSRRETNSPLRPFEGMVCANLSCLFSGQTAACCRRTREHFSGSLDRTRL